MRKTIRRAEFWKVKRWLLQTESCSRTPKNLKRDALCRIPIEDSHAARWRTSLRVMCNLFIDCDSYSILEVNKIQYPRKSQRVAYFSLKNFKWEVGGFICNILTVCCVTQRKILPFEFYFLCRLWSGWKVSPKMRMIPRVAWLDFRSEARDSMYRSGWLLILLVSWYIFI